MTAVHSQAGKQVFTIDCHYVQPRVAAAYLIVEGKRAAFVENNTNFAVPRLLAALQEQGLKPEQVEYIIITHVHLDHAGGTAALLAHCPNATVIAHPRAARHVIDPSRLVQSAMMVYGEEQFRELYGDIQGVPRERVQSPEDGATIQLGERVLRFIYTRGHANHHFCIHDEGSNGIFTGDSFGIGYPDLQTGSGPVLYPSTTPTDFDPQAARESVNLIVETGADRAYLTHFDAFTDLTGGRDMMLAGLDAMEAILDRAGQSEHAGPDLQKFCEDQVGDYLFKTLEQRGAGPINRGAQTAGTGHQHQRHGHCLFGGEAAAQGPTLQLSWADTCHLTWQI